LGSCSRKLCSNTASPADDHRNIKEPLHLRACRSIAIVSPDPGNLKVASYYAEILDADLAFIDKRRQSATSVSMTNIIGDVAGKTVLMFDDMITTGGTIAEPANSKDHGCGPIHVAATHGVFAGKAVERLAAAPIEQIVITDTVPTWDASPR